MRWWLRSPALHMLAIGTALFVGLAWTGGVEVGGREILSIPDHRVEASLRLLESDLRRPPTPDEKQRVVERLIDQEVLFRYALQLGMQQEPVVQRRLAQISEFVGESTPDLSEEERAQRAVEVGLHHGDQLVRRLLADNAARLIRAVVLVREAPDDMVEEFYQANDFRFMRSARTRITHVSINRLKHEEATESVARALLERIRAEGLSPEEAVALGDDGMVRPSLPLLADRDLARSFGHRFPEPLAAAEVGVWAGPIPSRYGLHLVFVHERVDAHLPPLDEVRPKVAREMLHQLADEWLTLRVLQLRSDYEIVLSEWAEAEIARQDS